MKRKCWAGIALAATLLLASIQIADAEAPARIAVGLYGQENAQYAPQALTEAIQRPSAAAESPIGTVSLDEVLYDGFCLHLGWSVENPTDAALLYTVDSFFVNGERLPMNRDGSSLYAEGAGSCGFLLGGAVEGLPVPARASHYCAGAYLAAQHPPLPEGRAEIALTVAVWRPIHAPRLLDSGRFEGVDIDPDQLRMDCLIPSARAAADDGLYCDLAAFRPRAMQQAESTAAAYAPVYQQLGWAELIDTLTVTAQVDLRAGQLAGVQPLVSEIPLSDCRMRIRAFVCTYAGGACEICFEGEEAALKARGRQALYLADVDNNRVLNGGVYWDRDKHLLWYKMTLAPLLEPLPRRLVLAPMLAHDPRWDPQSPDFDPSVARPAGVVGAFQLDLGKGIEIIVE